MRDGVDDLLGRGYRARREHLPDDAKACFAEAVALCRESGDRAGLARALTGLGQIERDLGNLETALSCYREAVAIFRGLEGPLVLAHTVRHAGDILRNLGRLDESTACFAEALAIYRAHAETQPLDLANTIRGFALVKCATGEAEEATALWQEARALYAQVHVEAGVAESDEQIARLTGCGSDAGS